MISLIDRTISIRGRTETIKKFEVWFVTPLGLHDELEDAVNRCVSGDLDPDKAVQTVCVAVGETLYEVMCR